MKKSITFSSEVLHVASSSPTPARANLPPPQLPAMSSQPEPDALALRQRAEARLQDTATAVELAALSPLQLARTLHELQVHQIELEMQNQELCAAQLALEKSRASYADLYDQAPVGYVSVGAQGRIVQANQTAATLLGMKCSDLTSQAFRHFIFRDDQDSFYLLRKRLQKTSAAQTLELRLLKSDGNPFWAELLATSVRDEVGAVLQRIVLSDISERRAALEQLQLAASVFANAREGIMITDGNATVLNVNEAFTRITGYSAEEVVGQNPGVLNPQRQPLGYYAAMWRDLIKKGHWYGEAWNRRKNGELYVEMQTVTTTRNAQGQPTHYVLLFSDITSYKAFQPQLEHLAQCDPLTNLPNRLLLTERLRQSMAQALQRGKLLGLAYLDLDGFKLINDLHGQEVGDQLLVALAGRLKELLREGDTLARMGGDEFVLVLTALDSPADCLPLLTQLLAVASVPFPVGLHLLQVSVSLGITFYPQADGLEAEQLLRQADWAMYQAKQSGKNRYHVFDAAHDRSMRGHFESLESIRHALAQGELRLLYQPKVNMRSGAVIGAEALIRWQHPTLGLLAPCEFLPVIEDHPLAIEVGEWVLHTALTQIGLWQVQGLALPVSVNIGALQLQQSDFVERLRAILASHPEVAPSQLELEMLETSALKDMRYAAQVIVECHQMGVAFALDDFGTGYSSLTYLKRLKVALLKIDQSFVRDMLNDPDDLSILQGIIGLAAAFHRQVIAEGVETVAHGTLLLQLGCELAQGYGIARPMPAADVPAWAARWQPDAAWRSEVGVESPIGR
jgi:diguanylate cyclase (GGDEF)-like protein/PAS domain S-box-containing protein